MINKNEAKEKSLNFIKKYPSLSDIKVRVGTKEQFFGDKASQVGSFSGAFYPKSRILLINTNDIKSIYGLEKTLRHELIGHAGINSTTPEEKKELLTAISNSNDPEIKTLKHKVDWLYPDSTKLEKAEEVFAIFSENPQKIISPRTKINSDNISYRELTNIIALVEKGLTEGTREQKTFPESDRSQFQKTTVKEPYYETVAKKIIEQLEQGTAPWQKPWKEGVGNLPHNPTTNARYKGLNSIWLAAQGREDPRWMTYKQAQSVDAQVKKGEKGTRIEYYKFNEKKIKRDENNKPVLDSDGNKITVKFKLDRPKVFSASVFNAEQIEGLPEIEAKESTWEDHKRAENILKGSEIKTFHDQDNKAYYSSSKDEIHLPSKNQFDDAGKYYATALHELGHATGHSSRLNRDLSGGFGSESYAKEELRAEISSLMVGSELGIGHDPSQHTAYVKSWVKALKDNPREITEASRDAELITSLVLSYEKEQVKSTNTEPENFNLSLKLAEKVAKIFTNEDDKNRFLEQVQEQSKKSSLGPAIQIKVEAKKTEVEPEDER